MTSVIEEDVRTRILDEIAKVEREEEVKVIYACESGSRAWGFESPDSDYDVRFIYVHRTDWYLTVQDKRDVIERPIDDELDISGWDLPKALKLLRKSNPPLLEWLQSPIVYNEVPEASAIFKNLVPRSYSPISCMYHYLHMGEGNYKKYLLKEEVSLKKYFYALRPVLACRWIERELGPVPTEFGKLMDATLESGPLTDSINLLLEKKMAAGEMECGKRIPVISDFLESEMERFNAASMEGGEAIDPEELDQCFRSILNVVNR